MHDNLLYYTVAAVSNDFTGYVVDYGTWPNKTTAIHDADSKTDVDEVLQA